jgi:hypothetical protein
MYQITNKDKNELINLLKLQADSFRVLVKERRLTGRESIIMSKALYLEHRLSKLKKCDK